MLVLGGWVVEVIKTVCQCLYEQSSWYLAVNWAGDSEKYETICVCSFLVFFFLLELCSIAFVMNVHWFRRRSDLPFLHYLTLLDFNRIQMQGTTNTQMYKYI